MTQPAATSVRALALTRHTRVSVRQPRSLTALTLLARFVRPEQVAAGVAFLVGPAPPSSPAKLNLDGGQTRSRFRGCLLYTSPSPRD